MILKTCVLVLWCFGKVMGDDISTEGNNERIAPSSGIENTSENKAKLMQMDQRKKVKSMDEPVVYNENIYFDEKEIPPYDLIGRLRIPFTDGKDYNGTASVLHVDAKTKMVYLISVAHNFVEINKQTKTEKYTVKLSQTRFERRENTEYGSKLIKSYKVISYDYYPSYRNYSTCYGGHDLAICKIYDEDGYYTKRLKSNKPWFIPYSSMENLSMSIFGYPGEKNGEMWGMAQVKAHPTKWTSEIIKYQNMDTTGGQSGSACIQPRFINVWIIPGVHTGYMGPLSNQYNCATKLTKEKIRWISKKINLDFICLKEMNSNLITYIIETCGYKRKCYGQSARLWTERLNGSKIHHNWPKE